MPKISEIFSGSDAKSRIIIVAATVIGIVGVIFIGSKMLGPSKTSGQAKVANAPSLQSIPGGEVTPEYYRALMKANAQSAKQAEITGTSAVPTLVSTPQIALPTPAPAPGNCAVTCPGAEAADVTDDIGGLVRDGKLSSADANKLLALAKNNVPVSEYAATLAEYVKQGKLTPEQARKLLAEYTRQHANANAAQSAQMMDSFIKSGAMSLEAADSLLALQKQNVSPADYQAALDKLVREGKLTPQAAGQLMALYNQQRAQAAAQEGRAAISDMVKKGEITADVANTLFDLQKKNIPVSDYAAQLDQLVIQGKMTPAAAAKLLAQYRTQRIGTAAGLTRVNPAVELANLASSGQISQDVANNLMALQNNKVTPEAYKAALQKLVTEGKLPPAVAEQLLNH